MNVGPLNRLSGTLGLLALAPTALLSATGHLSAGDTALRAGVTFAAVVAITRTARWYLATTAGAFERRSAAATQAPGAAPEGERRATSTPTPAQGPSAVPRRRRSDRAGAPADGSR